MIRNYARINCCFHTGVIFFRFHYVSISFSGASNLGLFTHRAPLPCAYKCYRQEKWLSRTFNTFLPQSKHENLYSGTKYGQEITDIEIFLPSILCSSTRSKRPIPETWVYSKAFRRNSPLAQQIPTAAETISGCFINDWVLANRPISRDWNSSCHDENSSVEFV